MKEIIICVFLFANLFCGESIKCYLCTECTENTKITKNFIFTCREPSYGCYTIHDVVNEDNKKVYYKGCFEGTSENITQVCKQHLIWRHVDPIKFADHCKPCFSDECNGPKQDLNSDSEKRVPVFLILFLVSLLIIIQK